MHRRATVGRRHDPLLRIEVTRTICGWQIRKLVVLRGSTGFEITWRSSARTATHSEWLSLSFGYDLTASTIDSSGAP